MELKFLCTYENLLQYLEHMNEEDAREQIMIAPYWEQITQWAPFPLDYMKPKAVRGQLLMQQIEQFKSLDLETKGNFLEAIINEGQADLFAQSTEPSLSPSWHKGVPSEGRADVWEKLKKVLYNTGPAQEFAPYMFGDEKLEIPPYAGYYFGCAIVKDYIHKYPDTDFQKLLKTPHQEIFNESSFS